MGFLGTFQGSSGRLAAQLGEALGQGLGEMTGSYFANSALNKVINDPNLKNADSEERFQALRNKLAPYGARGERMFTKQLELEQKGEQKKLSKLHNKFLRGENLTDQEKEMVSPEMINEKRKLDIEETKANRPASGAQNLNPFQKSLQNQMAKEIIDVNKAAQQARSTSGMLDRMSQLSKDFQGVTSYATANIPGTPSHQSSSEFEQLSNFAIEPILKLYNPAGALPQQKIEMIRNNMRPKWSDSQQTIDAKISGIKSLINRSNERQQQLGEILSQYPDGDIPYDVWFSYQQEAENDLDQVLQQMSGTQRAKVKEGTALKKDKAKEYYEMAGGNKQLAEQMAKEDGYSW